MTRSKALANHVSPTVNKVELQQKQEAAALFSQGMALHQRGQITAAKLIYEQVISKHPRHVEALHLLGVIAAQSKNSKLAVDLINRALAINPNHATAYSNLAIALKDLNLLDEAVANCDRAIALNPDYADAYYNRGNALQQLKRFDEAVDSYNRSIRIEPHHADVHSSLSVALTALKRLDEAVASCDRAIALQPDYADAHYNRGLALQELQRLDEAVASYDHAIRVQHDYAPAHYNRGIALKELNRLDEAVVSYERAIAVKPDYADAYWNKSIALLLAGELKQGWELYEWRWRREIHLYPQRSFTQPLWLGAQDIANKTILLYAEQGLGDAIQFCRYVKLVKARGARVLLEVPSALMGLLNGLEGVDELLENAKPLPAFDYHCPLLSLPLAFETELHTIPSPTPYLSVAEKKRDAWRIRLGEKKQSRVGVVWSGSVSHKNDHNRSLTLREVLSHLPKGFEYVSLQKEIREVDKEVLAGSGMSHFGNELQDFTDTAALCDLMDIVVSVDTSVAHLAGAMGKTTWVLLPYIPDWRWLQDREDSPWYQGVKLYRQDVQRQWAPVLAQMATDLVTLPALLRLYPAP